MKKFGAQSQIVYLVAFSKVGNGVFRETKDEYDIISIYRLWIT